jgi:hypothetical protein
MPVLDSGRSVWAGIFAPLGAVKRLNQTINIAAGLQPAESGQRALARLAGLIAERLVQPRIPAPARCSDFDERGLDCSGEPLQMELQILFNMPLRGNSGTDAPKAASA